LGAARGVIALRRVGHVAFDDEGLRACCSDFIGDRRDRRQVAADQREPAAFARERSRDRRAHSLGRPGDDRHASGKRQVHCGPFVGRNSEAYCALDDVRRITRPVGR
jgi:hypothetical protein